MDLVRDILLAVESGQTSFVIGAPLQGNPATAEAVVYHLNLLEQAGWVQILGKSIHSSIYVEGLTWGGHDFLETVRDPDVWRKTKQGAAKAGGASLSFVWEIAKAIVKAELQKLGVLPPGA